MQEYLSKRLIMDVDMQEMRSLYDNLPLLFTTTYSIFEVCTNGVRWVAIRPLREVGLSDIRRHRALIEKVTQRNCAVFLERSSFYSREKMIQEGIPFAILGKDIYLPFLGVLLAEGNRRELKPIQRLSFLTQKILLAGLYKGYENACVTELADRFGVSKMAVSKCFDEIEYNSIDVLGLQGKLRVLTMAGDKMTLWEKLRPHMRNPVIRRFALAEDQDLDKKAGMSALCEYSALSDNEYPTYAVTRSELSETGVASIQEAGRGELIGCVVLELGYYMDPIRKNVQDPISTMLSVADEIGDERVSMAVDEMLEKYVW